MRKSLFVIFILLGSAVGVFAALNESVSLKIVLGSIGAVAGAAIGGALAGVGRRHSRSCAQYNETDGLAAIQDEQARNYWLDRGRLTAAPGLPHPDDNDPHSHES
ncbi:MAG: hypothetical protein Q7U13_14045 [Rhodoferax sp.]|nr:hypothetical protein [Rhodoferax sp.]